MCSETKNHLPCVVLDTGILHGDYLLEKQDLSELLDKVKKAKATIYIPKVVLDEHISHYNIEYAASRERLKTAIDRLSKLPAIDVSQLYVPEVPGSYRNLIEDIISRKNIVIVDYPDINTKRVMERCLNRQKPFGRIREGKNVDSGFKDWIIWETILNLLNSSCNRVLFVSTNHNDFAEKATGPLHKDFTDDLIAQGYSKACVEFVPSLKMASRLLYGSAEIDPVLKAELVRSIDIDKLLEEKKEDIQHFMTHNPNDLGLGRDIQAPTLVRFIGKAAELILIAEQLNENTALIYIDYFVDSEVIFYMPFDYYQSKEREIKDLDLHAHTDEDNEFVTIDGEVRFVINVKFAFERKSQKISGFEVNQVWSNWDID